MKKPESRYGASEFHKQRKDSLALVTDKTKSVEFKGFQGFDD
jgi:hypothetical protein